MSPEEYAESLVQVEPFEAGYDGDFAMKYRVLADGRSHGRYSRVGPANLAAAEETARIVKLLRGYVTRAAMANATLTPDDVALIRAENAKTDWEWGDDNATENIGDLLALVDHLSAQLVWLQNESAAYQAGYEAGRREASRAEN